MIAQKNKIECETLENQPDEFFPCVRCASHKKTGSVFFWSWPGEQQKFCDRCIPNPGPRSCEIFMLDLDENFRWVLKKSWEPPIIEEKKSEVIESEKNLAPLVEEFFRCPHCRNHVSEFDLFSHGCNPNVWWSW